MCWRIYTTQYSKNKQKTYLKSFMTGNPTSHLHLSSSFQIYFSSNPVSHTPNFAPSQREQKTEVLIGECG